MNKIIEVTRHKDMRTLQEYFDDANKFSDHALDGEPRLPFFDQ